MLATNLLNAGSYSLLVYNRTASKAESLVAQGAQLVSRPVDAVTSGGIVATIVWDDAALESVVMSDGFFERLGPGGIHLSMSTVLPETAKKLAVMHAQHGSVYVDAPIFGRPEAAVARNLWIPFAGPQRAKERVRPLLQAMGERASSILAKRLAPLPSMQPCSPGSLVRRRRIGGRWSVGGSDTFLWQDRRDLEVGCIMVCSHDHVPF